MTEPYTTLAQAVPARFLAKCRFCQHELDTRADGVHQFVCGWTPNRSGGGAHSIALPQRDNLWAHRHCIEREARGYGGQGKML